MNNNKILILVFITFCTAHSHPALYDIPQTERILFSHSEPRVCNHERQEAPMHNNNSFNEFDHEARRHRHKKCIATCTAVVVTGLFLAAGLSRLLINPE